VDHSSGNLGQKGGEKHLKTTGGDGPPAIGYPPAEGQPRIYVGVDIGYREHVAAAIPLPLFNASRYQDAWKRAKTVHFSSDAAGFRVLRRYLDKYSEEPSDFLILLEPTGGYYAMTLLMYLSHAGYPVLQVENKAVKDYREKIFGSQTKTDDTDARLMARMGFLHEMVGEEFSIQAVFLTRADDAALRVMVRDFSKLQKEITRRLNQLQQVVAVTFPELKTFFPDSTAGRVARRLLKEYPTPQALAEAGAEKVAALLREAHGYQHAKRVDELMQLANESVGLKVFGSNQWRQGWIIDQLTFLEDARQQLIGQIRTAIADHPYTPIIESLPVKSPIWTATLIATIGTVERFPTYSQFKAYLGWYPKTTQSGTSVHTTGLADKGVRPTRNALGQMAALMLTPTIPATPFREYYTRLTGRGMRPATARGHVAGKLSVVLYGMLKNNTRYDAEKHRKALGLPMEKPILATEGPVEVLDEVIEALGDDEDPTRVETLDE